MLSRFSALFSSSAHVETYKDSRRLHKERGTQAFITVKNSPKSSNLNDDEPPGRIVKIFEETLSLQPEHTPLAEAAAGLGNAFGTSDVIKPLEAPAEPVTNKQKTDEDREIDAVASPQSDDPRARRNTSNSFLRRLSNGYFGLPRPSFGFRRSYKVGTDEVAVDETLKAAETRIMPSKSSRSRTVDQDEDVDVIEVKAQRVRSVRIGSH